MGRSADLVIVVGDGRNVARQLPAGRGSCINGNFQTVVVHGAASFVV